MSKPVKKRVRYSVYVDGKRHRFGSNRQAELFMKAERTRVTRRTKLMGLDFSHGDAHWSYGGFYSLRSRLCAVLGVQWEIDGQHGEMSERPDGKEPLYDLIWHSDCDGWLTPNQCKRISPRLRRAVELWPDNDYDKINALRLADGMDEAAKRRERLHFC